MIAGTIVVGLAAGAVLTSGLLAAALAGAAIGAGISLTTQGISGNLNWAQFGLDIGVGFLSGMIGGSGISRSLATVLGGIIGAGSNFAGQLIGGKSLEQISVMEVLVAGFSGAVAAYIGGAGARNKKEIGNSSTVKNATRKLNKVLERIGNGTHYKNVTTAQSAFNRAYTNYLSSVNKEIIKAFTRSMIAYGASTFAFNILDSYMDENELWSF